MKTFLAKTVLLTAAVVLVAGAFAQNPGPRQGQGQGQRPGNRMMMGNPQMMTRMMDTVLTKINATADQKAKVTALMKKQNDERLAFMKKEFNWTPPAQGQRGQGGQAQGQRGQGGQAQGQRGQGGQRPQLTEAQRKKMQEFQQKQTKARDAEMTKILGAAKYEQFKKEMQAEMQKMMQQRRNGQGGRPGGRPGQAPPAN